jgi:hypothetical protein
MIGSQNNPNSGVVGPKPNLGLGGSNPYVANQAQALQAQSNQNLQQNVLPGIGQGAQAAGMYGSSRQGIAQGQAIGNAQTGLNSSIANLYSNAYAQDQQAQLQREQMANQYGIANMQNDTSRLGINNQYTLGQGNLALGNKQADNSYNLGLGQQTLGYANLDSNNQQFGANYGLQSQNYQNQWANNNALTANQIAQTPINYFNQFSQNANQTGGMGGTQSQNNQGNPYLGALGGAQLGMQLFK